MNLYAEAMITAELLSGRKSEVDSMAFKAKLMGLFVRFGLPRDWRLIK